MTLTEYLQKSGETLDGYLARKKREQKGETTLSDYLARTRAEVATTDLSDILGTLEKGGYIDRGTIRSYKTRLDDFVGKYSKVYNQSNEDARNYLENLKKLQEGVDSYDQYVSSFASDAAYEDFYKKTQLGKDLYDRATGAEDFGKYAGIGAAIQNPTFEEADGKFYIFGHRTGAKEIGNIVTFSRDNNDTIRMSYDQKPVGDYRYSNFTDDEVSVYNYWLAKENEGSVAKGTAKAYLDAMDDVLNQREAGKVADRADGNMGLQLVFGVAAGLNQFAGGVQNMFRTGDGYIAPSLMDYASQYVREDLGDVGGQFLGNSTGQIAYDTVTTVANMLPSIMVSAMTGGTAGSVLGTSLMGFSAGGNYYREFLNSGMSKGQARALSVALGVWEGASEYYLGSIEGLGGKHASKLLNKTKLVSGLKSSASGFTRALMKVFDGVVDASTEGLEEVIQDIGSTIIKGTMTGEWEWSTLEEQAYSFTLGALSAAMMNAPGAVIGNTLQDADLYRNGKSIREMGGTEALRNLAVETANEYGGNDTLSRYAENVVKKPTAMNVGILNQRVNEARNQNNLRSIENALVEQMVSDGVEEKTAKKKSGKIAEKLLQEYNGEEIDLQKMLKGPSVKAVYDKVIRNADSEIGQREERHARAKQKIVQEYVQRGVAQAAAETEAGTLTGRFDTADGGRTVRNDTGEAVTIAATDAVASTDGGKLTLKLQNGETVSASDLSFGTKGEAVLYSVIADLGVSAETANKLLGVASGTDSGGLISVALGLRDAYWYGKKSVNYNALGEGTFTAGLAEAQRKTAYNLGKIDAVRETAGKAAAPAAKTADKTANLTKTAAKSTTAYPGEYRITDGKVPEVRNRNLNKLQKSGLSLAKVLSKLGADIYVYESTASGRQNGTANGYYLGADGSIHIDLNSGARGEGLVAYTLTHEFVHEMEQKSPELFRKYADLLFEELGNDNKSVTKMLEAEQARMRGMDEYKGLGDAKQKEIAYSEVVAKCSEKIFTDTDVLERFSARVAKADRTLLQKIVDFFQKIIDRLRGDYRGQRSNSTLGEVAVDTINRVTAIRDAFADAMADTVKSYQSEAVRAEETLSESGIHVDAETDSASLYSVRDVLDEEKKEKVAIALADRLGVTKAEAHQWLTAETSLASLILNPKYSGYPDYEADPDETAIKANKDYPQGTVDFSPICAKRREFTAVMNNVLRLFPDHVFKSTDLAKIRTIMQDEGMRVPCGICYVEDRRQQDTIVAQNFIDSLKLYREGSRTRPDGKPFNEQQIESFRFAEGINYTPSVYELVSLEGLNSLKKKNRGLADAWVAFNNARGMQSVRLLANEAEYKRQILGYSPGTVKSKNDKGGLRIYSFSDAEMFHLIDIIQVITDSAAVGLSLQGYTKVNEYAKAVKDTGEKLNRSLIPKGDLGYHIEGNEVVLDYDTVEGIDINSKDFFDNRNNPNVGNITIGINDLQIRAAMVSDFIDQIIPFHTGQSTLVLEEKGISAWKNYKDFQTEKDIGTGKVSRHQVNIYTEVLQVLEKEGAPITKRTFVEKFLQVCKENGLTPRFAQFLNTDENGNYVYTEGYHKLLVDFKTFAQTKTGEYLPQMPVKPIFDNAYITGLLKDYAKGQTAKESELKKSMPKVVERITNEIIRSDTDFSGRGSVSDRSSRVRQKVSENSEASGVRYSLRETDSEGKRLSDEQREYFDGTKVVDANGNLLRVYHGSPAVFTEFSYQFMSRNGSSEGQGIYFTQNKDMAEGYQRNGGQLLDGYLSIKKPLSDSKITLTPVEVRRLIQAIDPTGDDVIINYDSAGGMGYPSKTWYTRALDDTVRSCMEYCDSDSEILANIANSGAGAETVLLTVKRVLGYDGYIVDGKYENSTVYVAFTSEQFKNADNKKPTSSPDIRYSLREVEPVQPKSGAWERSLTTAEAKERFPHLWDVSAEESETRNPTQVKVTVSSYRKIYRYLRQKGFHGAILDASSGLGYGTRAGIEEFGFDVEDIEPYPGKNYSPKYTDYSALDKTYDVIISNAVLNVLPQDQRDALVVKMGEMLNPGGTMFINVRGDDVLNASTKEIISKGNLEVYISNTGSYQKGFTRSELVGYLRDALGDGFTVESTDMFGKVSAIVTKDSVKQSTRETAENKKTGYSYEELISKPDMKVTVLGDTAPANRADVVALARKNAAKIGKFNAKDGSVSVYVKDAGADVILSKAGLIHSLDRRFSQNAPVTVNAGEILANSVVINELVPKNEKASACYVLIGVAGREGGSVQIVESVVNRFSNELLSMDVLYSINAKQKGTAALDAPPVFHPDYRSTISIAELLEFVNRYFPDILPEDALRHYGYTERPGGVLGESALFSDRENVSARSLLANALESVAQNETEKEKLRQYKTKIGLMEQSEKQLTATRAKIRELSFSKGARDTEQIGRLQKTATELERRISNYDRQLFNLEASAPLRNVLSRESARVQKAEAARYREALNAYKKKTAETVSDIVQKNQESRRKAAEGRNKTEMRGKVKKVVGELNAYLKENKILIGMQKIVAEALDAVNMDTVGADARVAKYDALIAKETDPDVVRELQATRDRIAEQGETLKGRLERLKTAYADIINSDDPLIANAHDEVIENKIDDVIGKVGDTSIRDMTLEQLEEVYGMYRMILTSVRNANKVFLTNKAETITQLGEAVRGQVRATGGDHAREVAALRWLKKFGWKSLKPVYAMRMIGSDTFTELYENVRSGEDAWYRDMSAAKAFREEQYKKHGYSGWDFGKRYRFTAKSGKTFEMTLEQILSLYAYAKRPQATEHLTKGGIVFDGAIEVTEKKYGVPVKYRVNTATAFNLSEEVIAEICGTLSPEQRAFADEMQAYLSEVMGEKGNEVSLALYGVKLFKEKTYFPLKSARQFLYQQNEVAGEVRIRNSGFSKATVAHANNPIILSNFMDVWAGHCNDMAMYHSFVLPLEDFNRVWNYKTETDDKAETSSVKQALQNAYGTGVNEYISTLLTDLNGGARQSGAEEIGKLMSLAKKGAVFASASVTIQQPSAICRAMAYISPKYFAKTFAQAFNFRQHRAVWEECKKYAPVAGIKEMGYFDTGMGKGSVDWLKAEAPEGLRNKIAAFLKDGSYRDEVLSKAPSMADELTWCYIWNATKALVADTTDLSGEALLTEAGRKFTQVITLTQVYDSVLSRSGLMRSKDTGMKMATAFMAEPTTTMNMVADAFVRGKRIGGKQGAKIISGAVGAVTASIVLNSLLKAVVVAWRHIGDDDDETYAEKYGKAALEDFLDNFNPLTYIPFAKDIVSLCQGYDVSRMDMDLFEDLVSALKSIDSGTKSAYQKVTAIIGAVSAFFGIPFRNIERDLRPIVQKLIGAA